jgi:cellulose synthase/poly-beta-1,6-N-acetylglucosamine synthase-like glycosyltransferase
MIGLVTYNIVEVYLGLNTTGIDTKNFNQMSILVMCGVNIGGYLMIILLHLITHPKLVWRLFSDTLSYWFYQGAYSLTMVAHAFSNVDDVSWGTKGSTSQHGGKHY